MGDWTDKGIQRRSINFSAYRLDGLLDLLPRASGRSVFDIGCNRGRACEDMVYAGAKVVHGCDIGVEDDGVTPVVATANRWFADNRAVEARFEMVDLKGGPAALQKAFGKSYRIYDFMFMLAVYHKLRREMPLQELLALVDHFAKQTGRFFVWRGSREEKPEFEHVLLQNKFRLVHYSEICEVQPIEEPSTAVPKAQPAAIWARTNAR